MLAEMTILDGLLAVVGVLATCIVFLFKLVYANFKRCERDRELLRSDVMSLWQHISRLSAVDCSDSSCPIRKIKMPTLKSRGEKGQSHETETYERPT